MPPPTHQMSARGLFLLTDTSPNHNDAHQCITTTTPRHVTNDACPDVCHPTPNHPRHSTPPTRVINQPHGWPRHPPPRCRPRHPPPRCRPRHPPPRCPPPRPPPRCRARQPPTPPASQTRCRCVTTTMADASPTYQHPPTTTHHPRHHPPTRRRTRTNPATRIIHLTCSTTTATGCITHLKTPAASPPARESEGETGREDG